MLISVGRTHKWNTNNERVRSSKFNEIVWSLWNKKFYIHGIRIIGRWLTLWISKEKSCVYWKVNLKYHGWLVDGIKTYALKGNHA
jgi:hypothetical protein